MVKPQDINVLIACEESQAECKAFRERGFNAFSCDIQKCSGHHPEWHILDDVTPYLKGKTTFSTEDGTKHQVQKWHMIIAHPPCTFLCRVSAVQMVKNGIIDLNRERKMKKAVKFFYTCLNAKADFLAVENPIPMKRANLPKPMCYACPSWYGVKYTKKTLYWGRNLPPLMADAEYPNAKCFTYHSRGKYRSRTFPALAQAIAKQWGDFVLSEYNEIP